MKLPNKAKTLAVLLAMTVFPLVGRSQSVSDTLFNSEVTPYIVIAMVFLLALIILGVAVNVYDIIRTIVRREEERKAEEAGIEYVPEPGWFTKLMNRWNRIAPMEEEKSITLDHEYDGIRELDNHLPPWWLALFYGSMIFAVVYILGYHVMGWWPLQEEKYEIEMANASMLIASQGNEAINENSIEYNPDPIFISGGKSAFDQLCFSCHGSVGEGLTGPNLTDEYWLHGGSVGDIYKSIKDGIPAKGMASWKNALTPAKIAQVASYIISLAGSSTLR